jgi:hypothetical protein
MISGLDTAEVPSYCTRHSGPAGGRWFRARSLSPSYFRTFCNFLLSARPYFFGIVGNRGNDPIAWWPSRVESIHKELHGFSGIELGHKGVW